MKKKYDKLQIKNIDQKIKFPFILAFIIDFTGYEKKWDKLTEFIHAKKKPCPRSWAKLDSGKGAKEPTDPPSEAL